MTKALLLLICIILSGYSAHAQSWKQRGADITGKANSEGLGNSTSLSWDGKILAIGTGSANSLAGLVRVYEWNGSTWSQKGTDMNGATGSPDQLGWSVSLDSSGNTLAVGAPYADGSFGQYSNSGYVKVFSWSGTAWVQKGGIIAATDSSENCGYSVSLSKDGNTLAIGAPGNPGGGFMRGQARIYTWSGTAWVQKGSDINGEENLSVFGNSVSLDGSGTFLAIGAPLNNGSSGAGSTAGHARVYSWSGSAWVQRGSDIDGDAASDYAGYSVSLSKNGQRLAMGAPQDFLGGYGYVKIYDWSGSAWVQKGATMTSAIDADEFGASVSLSGNGDNIAIGAKGGSTGNDKGRAEVYSWSGSAWQQDGSSISGPEDYCSFGFSITMNYKGDNFACSAPSYNGTGSVLGNVQVYRFAGPCSATYASFTVSACSTYSWNGKNYTASGTYKDTIANAAGCDSIMTLNLSLFNTTTQTLATSLCGGSYISPGGKKFTSSGTYTDTLKSVAGCDSIIYTINLIINIPNTDGFVLKDSTMTATTEGAVAHGDIDNDGDEDILITGKDASGQLIAELYTNDGKGSFTKMAGTSFTGTIWGSASIIDVNGDSIPEIYISGLDLSNKPVANLYQYYQGSFLHVTSPPFNTLTGTRHKFTDVDNDGDQDLLISDGDSLILYKNHLGDFLTSPIIVANSGASYGFILTGDLNGDGYVDIIKSRSDIINGNNTRTDLLLNDKTGKFTAATDPFDNLTGGDGALADLNGDGKVDFIQNGLGKNLSVVTNIYTNDGKAFFTKSDSTSIKGYFYGSIKSEDFNNDGTRDILVTGSSFSETKTRLYIKNNKGQFVIASNLPIEGLTATAAMAFDMDNDGMKDLLVAGQNPANQPVTKLFKNKGCFAPCESETEITLKHCGPYTSPGGKVWTESGTYTEVFKNMAGCDSTVTLHLKTTGYSSIAAVACDSFIAPSGKIYYSAGNYQDTLPAASQSGCDSIISIELTMSRSKVKVVSFAEMMNTGILNNSRLYEVADADGDGIPDLFFSEPPSPDATPKMRIFKNNGEGKFSEISGVDITTYAMGDMAVGDIDADGKPDIVFSFFIWPHSYTRVYRNEGNGKYTEIPNPDFHSYDSKNLQIEDLDGDGKPDIFLAVYINRNYQPKIFKNDGKGIFSDITGTNFSGATMFAGYGTTTSAIKDMDGDGRPDILLLDYNSKVLRIYKNNGGGNFAELTGTNLPAIECRSIAAEDMDGDGKPDIVFSDKGAVKVYKNNGNGKFTEITGVNTNFGSISRIRIAELDGDGRPDLVVKEEVRAWNSPSQTRLYKNNEDGSFTEVKGTNIIAVGWPYVTVKDMDGDKKPEILITGEVANNNKYITKIYKNKSGIINTACIAPTGCNSYTSPSGKYVWTKSGVYKDTISLPNYDSIITVNLLIDSIEAKFIQKKDPDGKYNALIVNRSKGKNMRFVWLFGDGDSSTLATPTHTYAAYGTYNLCLKVTTAAGCTEKFCQDITYLGKKEGTFTIAVIDSIDGTMATGIEENPAAGNNNLSFSIYPNPSSGLLNVSDNNNGDFDVSVLDLSGRRIASYRNQKGRSIMDLSAYKPGMYIIEIQNSKGYGYYKVLKQ